MPTESLHRLIVDGPAAKLDAFRGDEVTAAAIDRPPRPPRRDPRLKGDSYRLRDKDLGIPARD